MAGADLLIHDSQYTTAEYSAKAGWGHSPLEYVVDLAMAAGVKRLALFHHDPLRDDAAIDRLVEAGRRRVTAAGSTMELMAAAEGLVVEPQPTGGASRAPVAADALGLSADSGSIASQVVVVAVADGATADLLADAVRPDGVTALEATDGDGALRLAARERPGLVILDRDLPGHEWLDVCRTLRAGANPAARDVPLVVVAAVDDPDDVRSGADAGVSDWLVKPFSAEYARTKVRAWLLRGYSRWVKAPLPPDEARRLLALRRLNILDTPAEERFDRLARLAQRLFQVPIALVSLVDADRQWFKSHQGLEARETSREAAFCAHAILQSDAFVVPDALQDPRFADNPLVTDDPRVRFYAGQPLSAPDGSHVGTLCIIDRLPRELDEADLQALRDLAALVEEQLGAGGNR